MGMVLVARRAATNDGAELATRMSGRQSTSSLASACAPISGGPTIFDFDVATGWPSQVLDVPLQCRSLLLPFWIIGDSGHQHTDPLHLLTSGQATVAPPSAAITRSPHTPATVSSARFKLRARSTQDSNRLLMNAFRAPVCEPWGTCQERLTVSAAILSQAM